MTGGANAEAVATTAASRMVRRYMVVMVVFFDCIYDVRLPFLMSMLLCFGNWEPIHSFHICL